MCPVFIIITQTHNSIIVSCQQYKIYKCINKMWEPITHPSSSLNLVNTMCVVLFELAHGGTWPGLPPFFSLFMNKQHRQSRIPTKHNPKSVLKATVAKKNHLWGSETSARQPRGKTCKHHTEMAMTRTQTCEVLAVRQQQNLCTTSSN